MAINDVLARVADLVPVMRGRAAALDEAACFPAEDMGDLAAAGVLAAPIPFGLAGLGMGTEPGAALAALELFRLLGRGNLALGRLVEAHVNALRLVFRFGSPAQRAVAAADARAGRLCGLWVTDPPGGGLQLDARGTVAGSKQFCSGAGHASRAVVTAEEDGGTRLAYVVLERGVTVRPLAGGLAGMRAATTGQVWFAGTEALPFGAPGDYLREPDFSCGAWRTSAATLGGLDALVEAFGEHLRARGRAGDPHQQARYGHAMMAADTARLWMAEAAVCAEAAVEATAADAVGRVGLARLAVERACLEVIELVQRSLGVAAVMRGGTVERICRDLATYLRQPAGDMVLTEAAARALGVA